MMPSQGSEAEDKLWVADTLTLQYISLHSYFISMNSAVSWGLISIDFYFHCFTMQLPRNADVSFTPTLQHIRIMSIKSRPFLFAATVIASHVQKHASQICHFLKHLHVKSQSQKGMVPVPHFQKGITELAYCIIILKSASPSPYIPVHQSKCLRRMWRTSRLSSVHYGWSWGRRAAGNVRWGCLLFKFCHRQFEDSTSLDRWGVQCLSVNSLGHFDHLTALFFIYLFQNRLKYKVCTYLEKSGCAKLEDFNAYNFI